MKKLFTLYSKFSILLSGIILIFSCGQSSVDSQNNNHGRLELGPTPEASYPEIHNQYKDENQLINTDEDINVFFDNGKLKDPELIDADNFTTEKINKLKTFLDDNNKLSNEQKRRNIKKEIDKLTQKSQSDENNVELNNKIENLKKIEQELKDKKQVEQEKCKKCQTTLANVDGKLICLKCKADKAKADADEKQKELERARKAAQDETDETGETKKKEKQKEIEKLQKEKAEKDKIAKQAEEGRKKAEKLKETQEAEAKRLAEQQNQNQPIKSKTENIKPDLSGFEKNILNNFNTFFKDNRNLMSTKLFSDTVFTSQSFPTVKEIQNKLGSLRDQGHHNTSSKIKKYLDTKNKRFQKYFKSQISYKLLFETLIDIYEEVNKYKLNLWAKIKQNVPQEFNSDPQNLETMWKAFLKTNFKQFDNVLNDIAKLIVNKNINKKYFDIDISDMPTDEKNSLIEYAKECAEICWEMVLQPEPLDLYPKNWTAPEGTTFDNKKHRKKIGFDKNSKNVLCYIWPVITRKDIILDDQKIDVWVLNDFYPPYKKSTK